MFIVLSFTIILLSNLFTNVSSMITCPDDPGWMYIANSCYKVSYDPMNWFEAQEYCRLAGGYLAEIQSKYEEDLLDQVLMREGLYWLGLNDLVSEGKFEWATSHEPMIYENFGDGEPNDDKGNEDCVYKYYDYWNDDDCNSLVGMLSLKIHALCEYNES